MAAVEGVPAIVFNFFNFLNFFNFCSLIFSEVHHKGGDPSTGSGVADSQSVVQAEHGAAGAHRSVFSRIIEFVAGTQIEHGIVISLDVNRREGAHEVNIVRIGMAAANGAYSNAAERGSHDVAARRGVVAVVGRVGLGLVPLHEVRRASSEGCQAAGGKVERQLARRDVVVGRFEGLHCGTCEGRALEHEVKGQTERIP